MGAGALCVSGTLLPARARIVGLHRVGKGRYRDRDRDHGDAREEVTYGTCGSYELR